MDPLQMKALAMYHLGKIVQNYREYPLSTLLSIENNNKLDFPAVTVCNMNPARRSFLKQKAEELGYTELIEVINEADAKRLEEESNGEEEEEENEETDEQFYEALTSEFMIAKAFANIVSDMGRRDRMHISHDLKDMLLSCTFEGRKCSVRNFTLSYNYKYGNCFTFNSDPNGKRLETTKPGPLYGLTMELYLDENEYSEFLADTVGAKIHIHQQGIMAFPEDDGISLTPGLATSVGISQIQIERSIPPHGRCRHYSSDDNDKINMYAGDQKLKIDYSEKACQKTCYQKNLIRACKCCHFDYPCSGQALKEVIEGFKGPKLKRCNESVPKEGRCMADVFEKHESNQLDCSNDCAQSCSETVYSTDISTGRWPSVPLIRRTMGRVKNLYKRKNGSIPTSEEDMDTGDQLKFLTRNVIKVEIFYKQLNYEFLEAKPAYDWSSLISDIGGQAGLWVGFSILTLIELAELLMDVIILISAKLFRVKLNSKVKEIQIQPVETSINNVS